MFSNKPTKALGKPIIGKLKDILCHEAHFETVGLMKYPAVPEKKFPKTTTIELRCEKCEKKYCFILTEGSDLIELYEIDDEIEIVRIMTERIKSILGINFQASGSS